MRSYFDSPEHLYSILHILTAVQDGWPLNDSESINCFKHMLNSGVLFDIFKNSSSEKVLHQALVLLPNLISSRELFLIGCALLRPENKQGEPPARPMNDKNLWALISWRFLFPKSLLTDPGSVTQFTSDLLRIETVHLLQRILNSSKDGSSFVCTDKNMSYLVLSLDSSIQELTLNQNPSNTSLTSNIKLIRDIVQLLVFISVKESLYLMTTVRDSFISATISLIEKRVHPDLNHLEKDASNLLAKFVSTLEKSDGILS